MTIIVASEMPAAARGHLKRWFVEPRPNVFCGSINVRTRRKTLDFIRKNSKGIKMLVMYDAPNSQGFKIEEYGGMDRVAVRSGLQLIVDPP